MATDKAGQPRTHQIIVPMFGPEHGGHLLEVGAVALFLHAAGEGDGDDALRDVHQVHFIVLLHGLDQTEAPEQEKKDWLEKLREKDGGKDTRFERGLIHSQAHIQRPFACL